MCRASGYVATVSRTVSMNQLGTRTRETRTAQLARGRTPKSMGEKRPKKKEERREELEQKDGSRLERDRKSERDSREKEKRDGETARILFAIKARDNLKAITITHGLRVHTLSPSALAFRDRAEDSLMVHRTHPLALFADRFA